jgi:uncharacterized protein YbbC (DUF1343 family)
MKAVFSLLVVLCLFGCQGSRQKAIETICKEVGKNTAKCTKTMGLISASVVENRFLNSPTITVIPTENASLLNQEDSFSW